MLTCGQTEPKGHTLLGDTAFLIMVVTVSHFEQQSPSVKPRGQTLDNACLRAIADQATQVFFNPVHRVDR